MRMDVNTSMRIDVSPLKAISREFGGRRAAKVG